MNLTRKVIPILLAVAMATVMTLAGVTPASAQPPEVWVDDNYCPACPNDGHTWGYDAFAGIQDGIDAVASPGTVHVAAGTYYENIILKDGVRVLGAGRDVTTIDGGGAGSVVTASGVGPDTVVDGFTITGGNAGSGGGMRNWHSLPTVTDCTFSSNSASNGGGICNDYYCLPTVTNCTFSGNSGDRGGGMYNQGWSSPTVTNCTFSNNSADYGGAIHMGGSSSPSIRDNTFHSNRGGERVHFLWWCYFHRRLRTGYRRQHFHRQ